MINAQDLRRLALGAVLVFSLAPNAMLASEASAVTSPALGDSFVSALAGEASGENAGEVDQKAEDTSSQEKASGKKKASKKAAKTEASDKVLSYSKKLIKKIGTQEKTGHTICCPSFSCAYGDAVLDGTVHGHEYYSCSCCTWTDWGGGGSFDRCVGTDEELLYEAYKQIKSGKPTVIHVSGVSGEHWICLIGYKNAKKPKHLTLANFIALDPWDGAEITASDRYTLYGDGCEHISDR